MRTRILYADDFVCIVRKMRRISGDTQDQTKDSFSDPFAGLTDEDYALIADEVISKTSGFFTFGGGVVLTWVNARGKLRFEVSAEGEQYARIITAINWLFQKEGLMAQDAMLFG